MKACIWSSPSMNERFEIRSGWSTKRRTAAFQVAVLRFSALRGRCPLIRSLRLTLRSLPPRLPTYRHRASRSVPVSAGRSEDRLLFTPPSRRTAHGASALRASYSLCPGGSNSRTDPPAVSPVPVFGTSATVLSGQVSSKTPFYAFCVATCPNKGSLCLDLFCVITGNTYL